MADSGIYEIVNLRNGKRYVGSAVDLRKRRIDHFTKLRHRKHVNGHLQRSFDKHGETYFQFRVIFECQPNDLIRCEQLAIDSLKPEFNICRKAGSTLGVKRTPAQCAAQSARMKGSVVTAAHRKKLSAALKGRIISSEHAAKIRTTWQAKRASGWRLDPECIARIAEKNRGRKWSQRQRADHSIRLKNLWADPEFAARQIATFQASCHTPEARAKRSASMRGRPGTMRGRRHTPIARLKMSATRKEQWRDPEYRAARIAVLAAAAQSPEGRAKRSAAMKKVWQTDEYRALQCSNAKQRWEDQEYRARRAAVFALPETRQRMSDAHKGFVPSEGTRAIWREQRKGLGNPAAIRVRYTLKHTNGRTVRGNR